MAVERVSPQRAATLLREGWSYLDVRSVPEFEEGHPAGAYNVPLLHRGPSGMTPNPDFLAVTQRHFSRDARLIIGCRSGARSLRAASLLLEAGYESVVDVQGGFDGQRDPAQGISEGWRACGLPVATEAEPGRSYESLKG